MSDREVPMFPLGMVVFPHQVVGLVVFEERYQQLLDDLDSGQRFATCLIARGCEVGGGDQRHSVGTMLQIVGRSSTARGQTLLMVEGRECLEITHWLDDAPYPRAMVRERPCDDTAVDEALLRSTAAAVRALRALQSEVHADECLQSNCVMAADPLVRTWQLCALTPMSTFDQFKVLSLRDANQRLALVNEICCERYGDYQRMLALDATPR